MPNNSEQAFFLEIILAKNVSELDCYLAPN